MLSAWIDTWLAADFANWSLDEDLARVHCCTLVLHGDSDESGSARHPERIAAGIGEAASTELIPHCGHVPHREKTAAVIGRVRGFLANPVSAG